MRHGLILEMLEVFETGLNQQIVGGKIEHRRISVAVRLTLPRPSRQGQILSVMPPSLLGQLWRDKYLGPLHGYVSIKKY